MQLQKVYLYQAREAWAKDDHKKAFELYEILIQKYPQDAHILQEYGQALYDDFGDLEKAALILEQALSLQPASIPTLSTLGYLYSMGYGKGYRAQIPTYQKILQLAGQDHALCAEAYTGIALSYGTPGSSMTPDERIAAFRKALEYAPENCIAHKNLGTAFYEMGDFLAAIHELEIVKRLLESQQEETDSIDDLLKDLHNDKRPSRISYHSF